MLIAAGVTVALLLSVAALVSSIGALARARRRRSSEADSRVAALEAEVRGLLYRVWRLESGGAAAPVPAADRKSVV